ncbi:hypothetical protein [Streptomyces sp. NPDC001719]
MTISTNATNDAAEEADPSSRGRGLLSESTGDLTVFLAVLAVTFILASVAILVTGASPTGVFTTAGVLDIGLIGAWTKLRSRHSGTSRPSSISLNLSYSNRSRGTDIKVRVGGASSDGAESAELETEG